MHLCINSVNNFLPDCTTSFSVDPNCSVFLSFSWSSTSLVRCFFNRLWQSDESCSFWNPFSR